jgi:hypothetical protein
MAARSSLAVLSRNLDTACESLSFSTTHPHVNDELLPVNAAKQMLPRHALPRQHPEDCEFRWSRRANPHLYSICIAVLVIQPTLWTGLMGAALWNWGCTPGSAPAKAPLASCSDRLLHDSSGIDGAALYSVRTG